MKIKYLLHTKIFLSVLYLLIAVITSLSVVRGGFALSGNGILIPDSWIFYSFVIFLVITVIQTILFYIKNVNYYGYGLWLTLTKLFLVCIVELFVDQYVFGADFMTSNNSAGFQSNIWYTAMVSIFIGLIFITAAVEIFGWVCAKKSAN